MQKILTISSFILAGLLFTQCATKKSSDAGTANKADPNAAMIADLKMKFTEAELQEGKMISETKCVKCHKLFEPQGRTIAKWEYILPKMVPRTKLTEQQAERLRAYVLINAQAG